MNCHESHFKGATLVDFTQYLVDRRPGLLRLYCWTSALLLSIAAFLKFSAALTGDRIMTQPDPVLQFVPIYLTALGAALVELAVLSQLVRHKPFARFVVGLAWMSGLFVIYRATMFWSGTGMPCRCLGHFGSIVGASDLVVDRLAVVLVLWFGIPSWLMVARALCGMIRTEHLTGLPIRPAGVRVVRHLTPVMLMTMLATSESNLASDNQQLFSVDGVVRRQIFGPTGELEREPSGHFHLQFDDEGRYSLSLMQTGSISTAWIQIGCDRSNVFEVIRTSVGLQGGAFTTNASWHESPRAVANIYPVRHPVSSGDLAGVIWATYLGIHAVELGNRSLPAFWQPVGVDPRAHCFEAIDRGGFAEGGEGSMLEYVFRPQMWKTAESNLFYSLKSEEDVRFRRMVERVVGTMPEEFVELRMVIDKSRAVGERLVPLRVTATMYYDNRTSASNPDHPAQVASIYEIVASSARVESGQPHLPANPGTLAVYDFRRSFNNGRQALDRVAYSLAGDSLDSVSQEDLDRLYREQLDLALPVARYPSLTAARLVRYGGMLTLGVLLLLPLVIWLKRRQGAQRL